MKNLALGALVIGLGAACGGGKGNLLDAGLDAPIACNPVAQTGCMANEKCTWLVDIDQTPMANEIGHIGCAPAGTTAEGDPCMDAQMSVNGGADTCVGGDLCISSKCKPICDPQLVDGAGSGACAVNFSCSIYTGVFVSTGEPVAGICEPGCDPLTQKLSVGTTNTAACGSPDPANPIGTCIDSRGFRSFHCGPALTVANTDRVAPVADTHGNIYGNGCAPGFIPFYVQDADAGIMTTLCSGMCAPLKVDSTIAADLAHKDDAKGDIKALGKLPADAAPIAGHATCDVGVKGSIAPDAQGKGVEDCRFLWFPLAMGDPTKALQTPYNDTLGICFAYQKYLTVTMPGTTQKFPLKSCAELPVTAPPTDPFGSAKENGCYPLVDSVGARKRPRSAPSFRLAHGGGPAVRHVFD